MATGPQFPRWKCCPLPPLVLSYNDVVLSGNFPNFVQWRNSKKIRTIVFFGNHFENFFIKQTPKVRDKIIWTFDLIEELDQVPDTYLKHLEGTQGLYEIRVQTGSNIFRIFCFFDQGKLVVLANGFQKKTQKTPKSEIQKALKIKDEYYESKKWYSYPRTI